jgi:hypothetical protein
MIIANTFVEKTKNKKRIISMNFINHQNMWMISGNIKMKICKKIDKVI